MRSFFASFSSSRLFENSLLSHCFSSSRFFSRSLNLSGTLFSFFWVGVFLVLCFGDIHGESIEEYAKQYQYSIKDFPENASEGELFGLGIKWLEKDKDILSAERVFRHLTQKYSKRALYHYQHARGSFFIAEYNYFPNVRYSLDLARKSINKALRFAPNSKKYLLLKSYIEGKIGLFIRMEKGGIFSGVTWLLRSQNMIEDILGDGSIGSFSPEVWTRVINRGEVSLQAFLTRAEVYQGSPKILGGDSQKAFEMYRHIVETKPENIRAQTLLGKYYNSIGQQQKALEQFDRVEKIYQSGKFKDGPEVDQVYLFLPRNRGQAYWSMGQYEKALEQFELHVERIPMSDTGYEWIGLYYLERKKDKEKALSFFRKALYYNRWNSRSKELFQKLTQE